ncbi:NAD(P)-binding protein [Flammula alnicola]|nr:NAD(P)-binding protein [Flammula alnicola]
MPSIDDSKCVLITGATSGIGRALALEIAKLPSRPQVIAAGRRKERLEELSKVDSVHPISLDVTASLDTLKKSVDDLISQFPDLDTLILNAGIQHEFDLKKDVDMSKILEEMTVNYTSVVALITYALPHFLKLSEQGRPSFIVTVTSGLGIVPAPWIPNYSASKAALRSFTTSLRAQLHSTNVRVMEIIPPLVESELHDPYGTTEMLSEFWMPLDQFTRITMGGLREGGNHIPSGSSKDQFERFEEGKDSIALGSQMRLRANWKP